MKFGKQQPIAHGTVRIQKEPFRSQTIDTDVNVPFLQAVVSAILVCSTVLLLFTGLTRDRPEYTLPGIFCGVMMVFWFIHRNESKQTQMRIDQITQGAAQPQIKTPAHPVVYGHAGTVTPEHPKKALLAKFIHAAAERGTSHRALRTMFSDEQIVEFRNALLRANLAAWRSTDHKKGWTLLLSEETTLQEASKKIDWI